MPLTSIIRLLMQTNTGVFTECESSGIRSIDYIPHSRIRNLDGVQKRDLILTGIRNGDDDANACPKSQKRLLSGLHHPRVIDAPW